ncbi:hypothetical protein V1477_003300 [Vespula maculifrons]|uniref:Uncharacterized protein n=1 Tax=Vespula maculifrons TaxID=7453 RepID=A0ABD2CU95_VESMC
MVGSGTISPEVVLVLVTAAAATAVVLVIYDLLNGCGGGVVSRRREPFGCLVQQYHQQQTPTLSSSHAVTTLRTYQHQNDLICRPVRRTLTEFNVWFTFTSVRPDAVHVKDVREGVGVAVIAAHGIQNFMVYSQIYLTEPVTRHVTTFKLSYRYSVFSCPWLWLWLWLW